MFATAGCGSSELNDQAEGKNAAGVSQPETTPTEPDSRGPESTPAKPDQPSAESDGEPDSPLTSLDTAPENAAGDLPPSANSPWEDIPVHPDAGWGELPRHVQDTFRAEGRGEVPMRYRSYIDAYYRRLNERADVR